MRTSGDYAARGVVRSRTRERKIAVRFRLIVCKPISVASGVTGLYGYPVILTVMFLVVASGFVTVIGAFVWAAVSPLFIPTM